VTTAPNFEMFIPGGVSSINRMIDPAIVFTKAQGAYLWDASGRRFLDYHAAFAPYLLGHNFPPVNAAVSEALQTGASLVGAGPSALEGNLAELLCTHVGAVEKVTFGTTGSEAIALAIRLARAITGKKHIILMQGGYNGNQDEFACNVFNTLDEIGPRVSPGEYRLRPLGAGTVVEASRFAHVVNFNDLDSVDYVCRRYSVAAVIGEPVLQNIGVVKPLPGYLEGLRERADRYGFLHIVDEVKTGFRNSLGGYCAVAGLRPDLVVYGKAVANGHPLSVLGGRREHMDFIAHPEVAKRPFHAGTYNGHPVSLAAAIRVVNYLAEQGGSIYPRLDVLTERLANGMRSAFCRRDVAAVVTRQASALSFYLMDHEPRDFHDILEHHNFANDLALRRALIHRGIFFVPVATKQLSVSAAHTEQDIDLTIEQFDAAVTEVWR
jgi:glutamate-1-semialdehyde 2,1-aminomutase